MTIPMPEPVATLWLQNGVAVNAFNRPPRLHDGDHRNEYFIKKGFTEEPLITTTQAEAYADARVREAQRWQPMETAPAEGRPVLLFAGLYRDGHEYAPTIVVGWHLDKEGWIASSYGGPPIAHLKPKAWMPLPAFPSTPARPESEQ